MTTEPASPSGPVDPAPAQQTAYRDTAPDAAGTPDGDAPAVGTDPRADGAAPDSAAPDGTAEEATSFEAAADAYIGPVAAINGATGEAVGCSVPPEGLPPQPEPVRPGDPEFREPSDVEREAALQLPPDSLLWAVDRHFAPVEGEPPPSWALPGYWSTDDDRALAAWYPNDGYRPSPDALGWPEPADGVDAAVRTIATGYDEPELLPFTLADAVVAVFVDPDGEPAPTEAPDGVPAVAVLAVPDPEAGAELPPFAVSGVRALVERIPEGHDVLYLSSTAPVAQRVTTASLRAVFPVLEELSEERGPGWDTPYTPPSAAPEEEEFALAPAARPSLTSSDGPTYRAAADEAADVDEDRGDDGTTAGSDAADGDDTGQAAGSSGS
ncbi:type VII secretion system-associated protein [Streptomyces bohaiensis]|uniref:type VII secretion system-associated protein n=1 Tax=Streptomyces bohaiensis TaxID=1431344 RepID=UPI003B7ABAC2